jgi:hypothetical protein
MVELEDNLVLLIHQVVAVDQLQLEEHLQVLVLQQEVQVEQEHQIR